MKKISLTMLLSVLYASASACLTCNPTLQQAVYDSSFYPNLLVMLSAFFVLAVILIILTWLASRRQRVRIAKDPTWYQHDPVPLAAAAMVLGIGIGGFIDGIALHQILLWHEMLSNKIPPDTLLNKSVNMFWDGIFHSFTLTTTCLGIGLLWRLLGKQLINRSGYLLFGGMIAGWGLFNLVEGTINHNILKLHNVRELSATPDLWNNGFLAFGVVLLLAGYGWMRKGRNRREIQVNVH